MAQNICIPIFEDGEKITVVADGAVSGKRFAAITGDRQGGSSLAVSDDITGRSYRCGLAGAGVNAVGVFEYDAADGDKVGLIAGPGHIVPVTTGAAVTAGDLVTSDAVGKAVTAAGSDAVLGVAMTGAGSGDDAEIKLRV